MGGSRAILVGLLITLTVAGKTEVVMRMHATARDRKPELGADVIRDAQKQINDMVHRRQAATAKLRAALARNVPDSDELEEAIVAADRESLASDPITANEYEAAVVLVS